MREMSGSDEIERRLALALRAEEQEMPVRLDAANLEARWAARRRGHVRLTIAAAAASIALVVVGLAWASNAADPILRAVAGPVATGTPRAPTSPGLSLGRATLTLTAPAKSSSQFDVTCVWSAGGHVVAMDAGRHEIAGEQDTVLWQFRSGPAYRLQLGRDDGSVFGSTPSRPGSNYTSTASPDGRNGTIVFTGIQLWSGDPASAAKRSGSFTWTCEEPRAPLAVVALPSPATESLGKPRLWMVANGSPVGPAFSWCPFDVEGSGTRVSGSCATANWWEAAGLSSSRTGVGTRDRLSLALAGGWTITHATVRGIRVEDALALPAGGSPPAGSIVTFADGLGQDPAVATLPAGQWYLDFRIEAARDDGSWLDGHYYASIEVTK